MKKVTVLGVCLLCVLMITIGFAPNYISFGTMPNANVAELEDIFLPPVATAEFPPILQTQSAEHPQANSGHTCEKCACSLGYSCDCGCGAEYVPIL